jgi:hypothetical protein
MDEWDKMIRQKVSGLDSPPPGTGWQPDRGWEKLQGQLKPVKPLRPARRWPWYYAAAASFVILLVPFAVMLSDIRRQQGQIERLAAQLAQAKPATPPPAPSPRPVPPEASPLARAMPPATAARRQPPAGPVAKRERNLRQPATPPQPAPAAAPVADRLARQPVPAVPQSPVEAAAPGPAVPEEDSQARLLRLVGTAPKREATSVTIVFAGTQPDPTGGEVVAANPGPDAVTPRRRFLRTFGGRKREETLAAPLQAPSNNILTLLTKPQ